MVIEQKVGLGPYKMFDSLLLVSLKMVLIRNLEMTMITGISEHIINFVKITSDREIELILHLIMLILKMFQTSTKASEVFNVETSTNFGKLVKKQNAPRNVLNIIFTRKVKIIFIVV